MSDGEQKRADVRGTFVKIIVNGRKRNDADWHTARLILSNKRLVLVTSEGTQTIPLSAIDDIKCRNDVTTAIATVSGYLSLQIGMDVTLVAPRDVESFEQTLYSVLLEQSDVLVKHPAVEDGVAQDTTWENGRLTAEDGTANIGISTGTFVELDIDDVSTVERGHRTVMGNERRVIEVEHSIEGTCVETHISGGTKTVSILETFVRRGEERNAGEVGLTQEETEVLMALHTGVSPFQIPSFVGMDVDQVEDIFNRLIEYDILEDVRTRREVELEARGRSIASDAMSDQ